MQSTGDRGAYSELKATLWLMDQGYYVFRNVSPNGPADLVAVNFERKETLLIDVKTGRVGENGKLSFPSAKVSQIVSGVRYLVVCDDWVGWPETWPGGSSTLASLDVLVAKHYGRVVPINPADRVGEAPASVEAETPAA